MPITKGFRQLVDEAMRLMPQGVGVMWTVSRCD